MHSFLLLFADESAKRLRLELTTIVRDFHHRFLEINDTFTKIVLLCLWLKPSENAHG